MSKSHHPTLPTENVPHTKSSDCSVLSRRRFLMLAALASAATGCGRTAQQAAADQLKKLGCDVRYRPVKQSLEVFWIEAPQRPLATELLESLDKFGSLETLILAKTTCRVDELSRLPVLPRLKMLDLSGNDLTDESLAPLSRFTSLETLILDSNSLTDIAITSLRELRGLKALSLQGCQFTAEGIKSLQAALPNCLIEHSPIAN